MSDILSANMARNAIVTTKHIAGCSPRLTITRHLAGHAYANHGNAHNPTPRYTFILRVDGIQVDQDTSERKLRQAAKSNGADYIAEIDAR